MVERSLSMREAAGSMPAISTISMDYLYVSGRYANEWSCRGSNPGPSACEADVIPLHHNPVKCLSHRFTAPSQNSYCLDVLNFRVRELNPGHLRDRQIY